MEKFNQQHEDLMKLLDDVSGVTAHTKNFEVQMAEEIVEEDYK